MIEIQFKIFFLITSGLYGLLVLIWDKVKYQKGSKSWNLRWWCWLKGEIKDFQTPIFWKFEAQKHKEKKVTVYFLGLIITIWYPFLQNNPKIVARNHIFKDNWSFLYPGKLEVKIRGHWGYRTVWQKNYYWSQSVSYTHLTLPTSDLV